MIRTFTVDLDGTLYDFIGGMIEAVQSRFDYEIKREDVTKYDLTHFTGRVDIDTYLFSLFNQHDFYFDLRPFPGAVEAVAKLASVGRVVAVSTRPNTVLQATRLAVGRDFYGNIEHVVLTDGSKLRAIRERRSRHHIDDCYKIAKQVARKNIHSWLIRTSYNREAKRERYLHLVNSALEAATRITAPRHVDP